MVTLRFSSPHFFYIHFHSIKPSLFQSCPAAPLFYVCFINCIFQLILLSEWLLFILSNWLYKKIYYYFLWSLLCIRHNITWFYVTLYSLYFWQNTTFWAKFLIHFPMYEFTSELVATKCHASVFIFLLYIDEALGLSLTSRVKLFWLRLWWSLACEKMLDN